MTIRVAPLTVYNDNEYGKRAVNEVLGQDYEPMCSVVPTEFEVLGLIGAIRGDLQLQANQHAREMEQLKNDIATLVETVDALKTSVKDLVDAKG